MAQKDMTVRLILKPDNMLKTIYTACKTCYSAKMPSEIFDEAPTNDEMLKLIKRVIGSGHYSTIEHIQITYAISGVSRACTHQLVRHRHMSFSQKSQRYVKEKGEIDYVVPYDIKNNEEALKIFEDAMKFASDSYLKLIELGIKGEDARALLPNATSTSIVASLNLRELIHLANLRLCTRAQREIRLMVKKMCEELIKEEPWLGEYLVPKCERLGFCDEDKSCGRMPQKL